MTMKQQRDVISSNSREIATRCDLSNPNEIATRCDFNGNDVNIMVFEPCVLSPPPQFGGGG